MPDIPTFLDSLPVVGYVFQFVGYVVANLGVISQTTVAVAVPITLAALCGVMCERSGVVNIGIEGTMLIAAFVGWVAGVAAVGFVPTQQATAPFGITPALLIGLAAAMIAGMAVSLLHAWLAISLRVDQIISGTIINIAALGVTGYLNTIIAATSPTSAGAFTRVTLPTSLTDLPGVGWILAALFNQGPITLSVLVLVIGLQVWLFRTRWGLRTRAVGEHPKAAETVGIDVVALRYRNVVMAGIFAGLGGAYLSMEAGNSFQANMTAGRGFIALAAMILGRWTPIGAFLAAVLFSLFQTLGQTIKFLPPTGDLTIMLQAPGQFYDALPYLVTIVVLAGVVGRSIPPAADGQPYEREAAT